MHKSSAGLLAGLGLAGAMATASAGQVNAPSTVTLVSHDGMAMQAPASGKITTVEGAWTFGATANAAGDYPLLPDSDEGRWKAVVSHHKRVTTIVYTPSRPTLTVRPGSTWWRRRRSSQMCGHEMTG